MLLAPINAARDLVAGSAAFQAWTGTADATAAAARVFRIYNPRGVKLPAVYAGVEFGDFARDRHTLLNGASWVQRMEASVMVYFRANVTEGAADAAAIDAFLGPLGATLEDMEKAAGNYALQKLAVKAIEMTLSPARMQVNERASAGDFFEAVFKLTYTRQP